MVRICRHCKIIRLPLSHRFRRTTMKTSTVPIRKKNYKTKNNIAEQRLHETEGTNLLFSLVYIYRRCNPVLNTDRPTCAFEEQDSQQHEHLQIRNCMCDEECPIYDDCCPDAKYENRNESKFSCLNTFYNESIYMVDTCKSSWRVEKISKYCLSGNLANNSQDIFLQIPVLSRTTNITYKNVFCALCNDDKTFNFWEVAVQPVVASPTSSNESNTFLREKDFWKNFTNGLIDKYNVHASMPEELSLNVRHCSCANANPSKSCETCRLPSSTKETDYPAVIHIKVENIPFVRICRQIPPDNSASKTLCQRNSANHDDEPSHPTELSYSYIDECFYETIDGKLCLINSFFESHQFEVMDEDTVFVYKYNSNFSSSEWIFQTNTSIYLCGTSIPQSPRQRWFSNVNSTLSTLFISASIVFLMLHLIMYGTTKKMRYPLGRIISCYSGTLLVTFTLFEITDYLSSCKIVAALLHYLFLSCFAWLVVASFDCWRTVTTPTRIRNTEKENSFKRFLIYCFVGWIFPLFIMSVAVFFELSPTQTVPCTLKPGYGRLEQCFIAQLLPFRYFFQYPSAIMFLINIFFFVRVAMYVLCNMSSNRNLSIFVKLALVTGLPWTIGLLVPLTNGFVIPLVYSVLNSSQGIFIFFAFTYDKEVIKNKLNRIIRFCFKKTDPNENGKVTFTKTIKRQASQATVNEYF